MKTESFLIATFICLTIFTSCGKNNAQGSIIGTWEADSVAGTVTGQGFSFSQDSVYTHGHSFIEIYNADSTAIEIDNTVTPADTTTARYYTAGGVLYVRETGTPYYISNGKFAVSGNRLIFTLSQDTLGQNETIKLYLTRQ